MTRIASEPWVLGIDTSAYTTSVAAVFPSGRWHQSRRMLTVPQGHRGLRPSEALFAHIQNLPDLLEDLLNTVDRQGLAWVAYSHRPRPDPDSYLPPFLAGAALGRSLAAQAGVPSIATTHQEGHIRAGLAGTTLDGHVPFLALHISGGTTELTEVTPGGPGWQIRVIAKSDDLYAGQMVDRIGVLLGLKFPAGPALEALANQASEPWPLPYSRPRHLPQGWRTSFSGPLSAAERALKAGAEPSGLALGVFEAMARGLASLVRQAAATPRPLLVIGGVAANAHLRQRLPALLEPSGYSVWFADPEWSRDNAIGVAYLALDAWQRRGRNGE